MKFSKYIYPIILTVAGVASFTSCSSDDLGETIFPDGAGELDPTAASYKFDKWLKDNYLDVYNLDFRYKMQDISTDMNYNLVPADFNKSEQLAVLCKYLWYDVYKEVAGPEFLKQNGPRILHIIGSPAIKPNSGTESVGLSEGGVKVSLFKVNSMDVTDLANLNENYFITMHHEFSHILHQKKSIPTEFNTLSNGHYDSSNWQSRQEEVVLSLGFVTPYGSSEIREDFAEMVSHYIVMSDADWDRYYDIASRGWETQDAEADDAVYYCWYYYADNVTTNDKSYTTDDQVIITENEDGTKSYSLKGKKDKEGNPIVVYAVEDKDGVDGVALLKQKISIIRNWFKESWNVDLDALREEVQKRSQDFDIDALLEEINKEK